MKLMLHAGAGPIDYDGLHALITPEATATHVPIPHFRVVDMLKHTLAFYGHEVTAEHFGVTPDGSRFFGLLSLRSTYGGYEDTVALRNSHDKSFPVGIGFGGRVFCCDNLSFIADHVIRRKHTANAKRDLPGLVGELVEPLALQRERQHQTFLRYQMTELSEAQANDAIMTLFRQGVINVQRIADVLEQWDYPKYLEWGGRTAWRLFNATTFALIGKVVENADLTPRLHRVIDGVCDAREAVDAA
ncbi:MULTISPECIES: DUF932 domain-containing protein [unclassified Devosia]|uniref:DUF932 domain-containing protein n=1 Tax=unclassified Devosia TaxID=196773 RepID=UPI00086B48E1|nr:MULTISPECIES: DUF932 domain-containing protein [unclassified Devosia]MBN9360701.1 DUF932 domain-containing protein [Devosia sp.]ODS87894.1 MAG: DUF932 domain-containing protein [Devosia sp. SCN 66-27]OJX22670.1 MAG: DUF932 domain-containing protein [Devosia sp. 66-14]